jgi:hypothetical protein
VSNWSPEWVDDTYERERDYELRKYEQPDPPPEPREVVVPQDRAETREAE